MQTGEISHQTGLPFQPGKETMELLVAEFSLLVLAEFLLSSREDDTRS